MHRAPALLLLLGCAIGNPAMAQAGGDVIKPIQGKIDQNAPKVRIDVGGNTAMLPAKLHEVKLEGGKKYQIDVVAKDELDPVIIVQDGAGKQLGFNDDVAPGNLNSRLTLEIATAGAYKLYVAALQHDDGSHGEGTYVLTVKQVGGAVAGGGATPQPIKGNVDQTAPKVRIEVNGKVASLPAKLHEMKLDGGKKYQFDVVAKDDLDPVIVIHDSTGKQLGFNDDVAPGNLNSRLTLDIAKAGAYKVYVAALKHDDGSHGEGDYVLTVKQLGGGAQPTGKALTLKDGSLSVDGAVNRDDPRVSNQVPFPAKVHDVSLPAGRYQLDLMSAEIDPVLVIADSAGKHLAIDDDGGEGLNSRLTFEVAKAGVYKVYAASLGGKAGNFTLTIKSLGAVKGGKGGDAKVLDVGARGVRVNGALSRETKSIAYRVKLEQGKSYLIEMNSANQEELDPFVEVHNAAGQRLAQDDDGAGDLNARLVFRAPESGVYVILTRSFNNSGVGDFTLSVKEQE